MRKHQESKPCLGGKLGTKCDAKREHSVKYNGVKQYCTPCFVIVCKRLRAMSESPVRLAVR